MISKLCCCTKASPANENPASSDNSDEGIVGNTNSALVETATSASLDTPDGISSTTPRETYVYDGWSEWSEVPKYVVHVKVSDGVTQIGEHAFIKCVSLETIKLPESITNICWGAFSGCSSLSSIHLPSSVTKIDKEAFEYCYSLTMIHLPSSLTTIGERVFQDCGHLEEIIIPPLITSIPESAFSGCCRLKKVVLPHSLKSIADFAFTNCASLATISLPTSIEDIDYGAFMGCLELKFEDCTIIDSIIEKGGVDPREVNRWNPWRSENYATYRDSATKFKDGPGPTNGFGGETQRGWGPEMWGITRGQIWQMKNHPFYNRKGKDGKNDYFMREFVEFVIKLITNGTGMGYSLLINQEKPLKAEVMVSHAWQETVRDFVEAIEGLERSGVTGPFWVCALSIHQNDDESNGVTIAQQLGTNPEIGPFTTVLKSAKLMVAVLTSVCDIYTRLWCVYEMHVALSLGVRVQLCPHINSNSLLFGRVHEDICVDRAKNRVDSNKARCGYDPDEIEIRKVINATTNGFDLVNKNVERIRLSYLTAYPTHEIQYKKSAAHHKIKNAIEILIPCINMENNLKTYEQFVQNELKVHPGWREKVEDEYDSDDDHSYYIERDGETPIDVFKKWSTHLQDVIMPTK